MSGHPLLTSYLAGARWFAGKGRSYAVVDVERVALLPGSPPVSLDLLTVQYDDGSTERYQLPRSHYADAQDRLAHAHVGPSELGESYDAVHDPDAMAVYLSGVAQTEPGATSYVDGVGFFRVHDHALDTTTPGRLFSGEQSNSSVVFGDTLVKVFRKVTPGRNPDIEVHRALTEAGSHHVAALYGWIEAGTDQPLDLAMVQQFLSGAQDGWDLALASARQAVAGPGRGDDFAGEAERLGAAVAEVHEVLRTTFGDGDVEPSYVAGQMRSRLDAQLTGVPELAAYAAPVRAVFDLLGDLGSTAVQRVHGDLHLGQTLRVGRDWKLVDFEGQPAKPLAERVLPDSPWRDVAGMLRSFDYAARSVTPGDDASTAAEWLERSRAGFLRGYLGGRGLTGPERILIDAYEADKAVYEVGYEARNRPTWVTIPLAALARLDVQHRTREQERT